MKYATAAAFRQALDDRLKAQSEHTGLALARLRKRVAFELFLRRLVAVAPDRWVLKGAPALDFRFKATSRPTKDMDLGRTDDEDTAIEDFAAAQELCSTTSSASPSGEPTISVGHRKPDTTLRIYAHEWKYNAARRSQVGRQLGELFEATRQLVPPERKPLALPPAGGTGNRDA